MVFCEGEKSEPDYINGLRKRPHMQSDTALSIEIFPQRDVPLCLVEHAVAAKSDSEIDELWCLFDVEWPRNHPDLQKAVQLAARHDIELAISNPCFEIWLMLHFEDCGKFLNTSDAEKASRKLDGRKGKGIEPKHYMEHRNRASIRAKKLRSRHERDGTKFPHDNPSTGMFEFLAAIERSHGK